MADPIVITSSGATCAIDLAQSNNWVVTLTAATVTLVIVNTPPKQKSDLYVVLKQDVVGSRVATWTADSPAKVSPGSSNPQPTDTTGILVHMVTLDGVHWFATDDTGSGGVAGVSTFNTRTGAVTLAAADVEATFTAAGQIPVGTGSGTGELLAAGATGKVLTGVTGAAPAWSDPAGGAPSGSAGGDLTGTYPNPTLGTAGPGATGPLGGATVAPIVTIDAKGRVTALSSATITQPTTLPPNGTAGGDLSGSYPNPGVAKVNGVAAAVNAVTVTSNAGTVPVTAKNNTFTNSSAATMAITMAVTSAYNGQPSIVRIYDFSGVAQTIGWTNTENSTVSAPTTSNGSATLPLTVGFIFNGATSLWRCVASA